MKNYQIELVWIWYELNYTISSQILNNSKCVYIPVLSCQDGVSFLFYKSLLGLCNSLCWMGDFRLTLLLFESAFGTLIHGFIYGALLFTTQLYYKQNIEFKFKGTWSK